MAEQLLERTESNDVRRALTPEALDRLEALAREPVPHRVEPELLRALVREAREARRLRRDLRDQEPLMRLRAQELALDWFREL